MKTNKKLLEENEEKEFDTWCKMLYDYTYAMIDNPTVANKWIFDRASHDEWVLSKFPKHLASVNAYNEFYKLTGQDIRNFDWLSSVTTNKGIKLCVHQHFVDEHLTTAFDFKNRLLELCAENKLTIDKIKELISQQRLCWITKEENKKLSVCGFIKHRESPLEAYKSCGIEIYDKENEDLTNIQTNPNKQKTIVDKQDNKSVTDDDLSDNERTRRIFFNQLNKYFQNNYPEFKIKFANNCEHFDIYKISDLSLSKMMTNVRILDGQLNDICVFFSNVDAKYIFDNLLEQKNEIENLIGYSLVWDRNECKQATRIGRFGKFYRKKGLQKLYNGIIDDNCTPYDFDLDVEKVATELVKIYNEFMPRVKSIIINNK